MRSFTVICLLAVMAGAYCRPETYTDKFDSINLDEILGNKRLLAQYVKCLLGEGNCTPEGKELQSHIRDALETECSKCTEKQKNGTRRVIGHLINKEPEFWTQLCSKYDPDKKYAHKYEKELRTVSS